MQDLDIQVQNEADRLAESLFGVEFAELAFDALTQDILYGQALQNVVERQIP